MELAENRDNNCATERPHQSNIITKRGNIWQKYCVAIVLQINLKLTEYLWTITMYELVILYPLYEFNSSTASYIYIYSYIVQEIIRSKIFLCVRPWCVAWECVKSLTLKACVYTGHEHVCWDTVLQKRCWTDPIEPLRSLLTPRGRFCLSHLSCDVNLIKCHKYRWQRMIGHYLAVAGCDRRFQAFINNDESQIIQLGNICEDTVCFN